MSATDAIPRLQCLPSGNHQLVVDGQPFLARAAELQNSSFSSARYMSKRWENLLAQHVNTVLGPVSWEQIEPKENCFEWQELDQVINDARGHGLKLVLLWFGTWKNGMSTYVPGWVKTDPERFPRARIRTSSSSRPVEVISPFSQECLHADARAFKALMEHLVHSDTDHTVIMVQVENEVGLLGDSRDWSSVAERLFNSPVPHQLIWQLEAAAKGDKLNSAMRKTLEHCDLSYSKTWSQTFGDSLKTDEIFMAYHYACFVESVARAGKQAYPLPLFTNAWLQTTNSSGSSAGGGAKPGQYPSGGPTENVLDIWQLFAPSLDCIGPDIYLVDYVDTFKIYKHNNAPLLVPEHRRDEFGALRLWDAIGHGALAASPFGIDTLDAETSCWTKHFGLLRKASAHILRARQRGMPLTGFHFDRFERGATPPGSPKVIDMGEWTLTIDRAAIFGHPEPGYGIVLQQDRNSFLLVGEGYIVTFRPRDGPHDFAGILSFTELECVDENNGEMRRVRRLNGDETKSGQCAVMPTLGPGPDYAGYPIAITVPGETGLAECVVYKIADKACT